MFTMSRQYSPKSFLRHVPNQLLKQFFDRRGQLGHILWYLRSETEIEPIYEAWQALPESQRLKIERTFQAIDEMACEAGFKALVEEAQFQGVDLAAELDQRNGFHDKAMWAYLHHEQVFDLASLFNYVEGLPNRSWVHVTQMPRIPPDVSDEAVGALGTALSDYYQREQGRGHHCTVEPYLRGKRYYYFFAYPDDYADIYIGHSDDGRFVRRPQKRAFEVVFVLDSQDGVLDLYAQGDRRLKAELRRIFCTVILHDDGAGQFCDPTYDLRALQARGFSFPTDPEDGIEEVRIRRMRLSLGSNGRRIVLETAPKGDAEEVYDMMDEYLTDKCLRHAAALVTQVTLEFRLVPKGGGKSKKMAFDVTCPDSSTLKSLSEDLRLLGEKYLKQWGIDRG
jgi:hypothetical protein